VQLKFAGASTPAAITGRGQVPGKTNYFLGKDPKQWRTNVANYERVEYRGVYPGVDVVFHGNQQRLEYDFIVAPGANPHGIALDVEGAKRMRIGRRGEMVLGVGRSELELERPIIYQEVEGKRREVAGEFVLRGPHRIGFSLGPYDRSLPLVIDPTLVYSTYLGGSSEDTGSAIAVDSTGNVYVTGAAGSIDFPVTPGAFISVYPYTTVGFVSKLNPSGSALIYSTYFGSSTYPGDVIITGIAVDTAGDAYLTGNTEYNFPTTPGAFQTSETDYYANYAFATELNPTGTGLVYSTFLGGTEATGSVSTYAFGIVLDAANNAYVVGSTTSPTYPTTPGAFQPALGAAQGCAASFCGEAGFVTKVSAGGASLSYSTYLGTGISRAQAVAVDSSGDAFVVGNTDAPTFPVTPGAFQTSSPSNEALAFVTKLNPTGTALIYSTFLAGTISNTTNLDEALAVAVDASGCAYVTGQASDSDFPTTPGAYQRNLLDYADAFVTKFNPSGSALVYSTYLPGVTTGSGIGVNSSGEAYVTGYNDGYYGTFPTTPDAFQTSPPTTSTNGFLTVFNSSGSGLVYSTYIGLTGVNDYSEVSGATGIALDSSGNAYVTGTAPQGFPTTPGALKTTLTPIVTGNGSEEYPTNAFIMKFTFAGSALSISPTTLVAGTASVAYGPVTFTAAGATGTVTFAVTTGSPPSGLMLTSAGVLSGTPTQTGTFPFTVTATDSIGDTGSQAYTLTIGGGCPTITVGPSTLANGTTGTAYPPVTFTETGGVGTITFSESGALPTGMTFLAGVLQGTPTQSGSFPITFTATDSNGCSGVVSDTLTISAPLAQYSTIGPINFGAVDVNSSATQQLMLTNQGNSPFTINGISLSGSSTAFTVTNVVCNGAGDFPFSSPVSLGGGQSCTFTLQFAPTSLGTGQSELLIVATTTTNSNAGAGPGNVGQAFLLLGTGVEPYANYSPPNSSFDFGNVTEGQSATYTITLTNTGTGPLALNGLSFGLSTSPGFSFTTTCNVPSTINSGGSCTVTVQFAPTFAGASAVSLAFADNAGSGESNLASTAGNPFYQVVSFTAAGVAPAPPAQANLAISKTAPSTVSPGGQLSYAIKVQNTAGPNNATTVVVTDPLPLGLSSASGSCNSTNQPSITVNQQTGITTVTCTFAQITVGSSVNMTITATLSSTATDGQTLTNMATVSEDEVNANTPSASATTTVSTSGGGGTPTCGCSKTGAYVAPNQGSGPTSTSGTYSVNVSGTTLTVKSGANTLFTLSVPAGTAAGLSPDGVTLEADEPGQGVSVYNLKSSPPGRSIGPTPLIGNPTGVPSRIQFSPSGQYLAYTTAATPIPGQNGSATLVIYNLRTEKMVYENSDFSFYYPPGGISGIQDASGKAISVDAFGTLGDWGFSPDNPETSFVYAYLTDQNSVQWNLVHLEQPPSTSTVGHATTPASLTNLISAFWQFSPCGDVVAIVTQPSSSYAEIQFFRAVDGTQVKDYSGVPVGNITLSANSTPQPQQVATDVTSSGTQTYTLDDSANNLGCSAQNVPAGAPVTVQPAATGTVPSGTLPAPVTLSFPSVSSPGGQVSLSVSNTGTAPLSGFELGNPPVYYDLTITPANLGFMSPITICINYMGLTFSGQPALFHLVNGSPRNITTSVDTINHIICGSTPSLSPFAIFGATGPVSTTTGLTSSPNPSLVGQAVTLGAQVSPSLVGTPTGTVTFSDGGTAIGTAALDASGTASFTTSSLAAGVHPLTAAYSGDLNFSGSSSQILVETISVPGGFSLSATPPSLSIPQGQSGTTTITVTSTGYAGTLTLSCPTLPSYAACVFSPSTFTLSSSGPPVPVMLTIYTTGPNGVSSVGGPPAGWEDSQHMRPGRVPPALPAAMLLLIGMLAFAARQKNEKKLIARLALIVLLAGLGMLTACYHYGTPILPGAAFTPSGQSNVVVSVSGSGTTQTLTLPVTITRAQ